MLVPVEGEPTERNERMRFPVILFDLAGSTEVARWSFHRAWPTKCELPAFTAKGNDIAIETLVLAHEGLTRP